MRHIAIILLLGLVAVAAPPAFGSRRVTVEQLQKIVASSHQEKDARFANQLYDLELSQQLSAKKRTAFEAELPGRKSRQALEILADQAVFLPLPAVELPKKPAPSLKQQEAMVHRAIHYVVGMLHQMPNLFARMKTTYYAYQPGGKRLIYDPTRSGFVPYRPIHRVTRSTATVFYRHGREVIERGGKRRERKRDMPGQMMTNGEFGPIFSVIFGDLPKGKLEWSHWVKSKNGLAAVLRYSVPRRASHYRVGLCCVRGRPYIQFSAYHGELTIDPATGTILRMTMIATIKDRPGSRWKIMVKYGLVVLGGKKYFCPVKSIALYRGPAQDAFLSRRGSTDGGSRRLPKRASEDHVPSVIQLNETIFDHYHLFRVTVRMIPIR